MKKVIIFFILATIFSACGNDYYHDSGLANGDHDCTVWDYLQNNPNNWDSVVTMIKRAGIQDIFDGSIPEYKQITFFGPVNYSVTEFLLKNTDEEGNRLYNSIQQIPKKVCKQLILSHVVIGRKFKEDFNYEIKGTDMGGTIIKTMTGIDLRVYRIKTPYNDIPDIGPEYLAIHALDKGYKVDVASANIKMTNGIVHSLSNTYEMVEL